MKYTVISRELLEKMNFRPFTKNDFYGFAGVESPIPFIGELEAEGILVIIDGDAAELYADDGSGGIECVDSCENIRALPYKSQRDIQIENRIKNLKEELAALENELCY